MTYEERQSLLENARRLARLDIEVNGFYANAPYTLNHQGARFRAKIRESDKGETTIVIIQPEQQLIGGDI